jgi:hypothetical protein
MVSLPGHHVINGVEYICRAPGNIPFCHGCRQRVEAVAVINDALTATNPVHLCVACIRIRLNGFEGLTSKQG